MADCTLQVIPSPLHDLFFTYRVQSATPASEHYILTLLSAIVKSVILKSVQTYFDSILKVPEKDVWLVIYLKNRSLNEEFF